MDNVKQPLTDKGSSNGPVDNVIRPKAFQPSKHNINRKKFRLSTAKLILAFVLLISTVVVWFLLTAKSLVISINPIAEQAEISGGFNLNMDSYYLMRSGQYQLNAKLTGYYPINQTITINEQQNQTAQFNFLPLPGLLVIAEANNIIGDVFIDGELKGKTSQTIDNIAAGEHSIKISADRYQDYSQIINIEGKSKTQTVAIQMKPNWAEVFVSSVPKNAILQADGNDLGSTPITVELLAGTHQLSLRLDGYKTWEANVDAIAQQALSFNDIALEKLDGQLRLQSSPSQATVMINNRYVGKTPIDYALSPSDQVSLTLVKDGFQTYQETIAVSSGRATQRTITLQPTLTQIQIKSVPNDALLYIDDVLMGRANQAITLTASNHKIKITKEGYVDYETNIVVKAGLQQALTIPLKTLEQAKWENTPKHITSVAGNELTLFKPNNATFTKGTSRREQGRRANEAQHLVKLTKPFYFGRHEVTNAQYRMFERQHSSGHVKGNSLNNDDNPVVNVTWKQAALYCNWLSEKEKLPAFYIIENEEVVGFNVNATGYRLPTEAEWIWLAKFKSSADKKYAWGQELPPTVVAGNIADRDSAALNGTVQPQYQDGFAVTAPVASFSADEHGLYDLAGNAAEWVTDFYEIKTGLSLKADVDPIGPDKGDFHVIRGTSWRHGSMTELRLAFRDYGDQSRPDVGFRIARFVE